MLTHTAHNPQETFFILSDPRIALVMSCIDKHGYWYAYWCMRQNEVSRLTAIKILFIARQRAEYEYWSGRC